MENLYTRYVRHIRHFGDYAAHLRDRAAGAEAKLRELIEAAEWRDECNDLFTDMNIDWINGRPEGPHIDSIYEISEEAEIAYEKALRRRRNDV